MHSINDKPTAVATAPTEDASPRKRDALSTDEELLIVQGLYALRERKVEAFTGVQAAGLSYNGRRFGPEDFGIPQIDGLLRRFEAD